MAAIIFGAVPLVLTLALVAINIAQNGRHLGDGLPPGCVCVEDVKLIRSKADFCLIWHLANAPSPEVLENGGVYEGHLINLGILARVSAFITNRLFAPPGHRWAGKLLGGPKPAGANIFAPRREGDTNARGGLPSTWCKRRGFGATIGLSRLDGRPCLVLDYSHKEHGDSLVWGGVMRMRDELREVAPGMLLGLGSMKATGGARNCAPFVLVRVADAPAVEPASD